jgi:hypothetical protein
LGQPLTALHARDFVEVLKVLHAAVVGTPNECDRIRGHGALPAHKEPVSRRCRHPGSTPAVRRGHRPAIDDSSESGYADLRTSNRFDELLDVGRPMAPAALDTALAGHTNGLQPTFSAR